MIDLLEVKAVIKKPTSPETALDAAICIAKSQLYRDIPDFTPAQDGFGHDPFRLIEASLAPGELAAWLVEAKFSSWDETDLQAYTVAHLATQATPTWSSNVAPPENQNNGFPNGGVHLRGWWPYSAVYCDGNSTSVDCCPGESLEISQVAIMDQSGADTAAFAPQPFAIDPWCAVAGGVRKANEGLYGVNAVYRMKVNNKCESDGYAYSYLRAREVGYQGKFWGAARLFVPNFTKLGVPKIYYRESPEVPGNPDNLCSLNDPDPVTVPAHTHSDMSIFFEVASGGAAETPVNIVVANGQPSDI